MSGTWPFRVCVRHAYKRRNDVGMNAGVGVGVGVTFYLCLGRYMYAHV